MCRCRERPLPLRRLLLAGQCSIFRKAQAAGDVARVAEFFKEYERTFLKGRRSEESRMAPVGAPASQAASAQQQTPGEPEIDQAFIDRFYDDSRRGKYRGRLKEQQEIERRIDDYLRALAQRGYQNP